MRSERLSQPAYVGPTDKAADYQRHPIPGQQALFATATARTDCPLGDACRRATEYCPVCERYGVRA